MAEKDDRETSNDIELEKLEAGDADDRAGGAAPLLSEPVQAKKEIHPAFYIALWITLSSSVIIYNKWVLSSKKFEFPLFLTTWHMLFAAIVTQCLARFTKVLDSRHKVPMNLQTYIRAIVPIGFFFSFSLICGNLAYLYLSVSFIQMLKASNAIATLLATWAFRIAPPDMKQLANVSAIFVGVVIASFGEIKFVMFGFIIQVAGIIFEAIRLVMVQRILSSPEFKMDPLVSLYYYAPACAVINGVFTLFLEMPKMSMGDINNLGYPVLFSNALVAFLLNVSVVFLIGKTSAVVLTLSGVLKDILLVVASMVIFLDPVSPLQAFGYSIALGGLIYYKLGGQQLKTTISDAQARYATMRQSHPIGTRAGLVGIFLLTVSLILIAAWPALPAEWKFSPF